MADKSGASCQTPDSWACVDCGINTAPSLLNRKQIEAAQSSVFRADEVQMMVDDTCEVYAVKSHVWKAARMAASDGCLCIGCLETRIGRLLKPNDFDRKHPFDGFPCTERLHSRRMGGTFVLGKGDELFLFKNHVKVGKRKRSAPRDTDWLPLNA